MASPILIFFLLISAAALPLSVHSSGGFSIDLIHRDSPSSPSYDPSLSRTDRLRAAARRSAARVNHFRAPNLAAAGPVPAEAPTVPIDSPVFPDRFEYLMSVNVGTPPFKIMAIADTGSDLIWTQCKPCVECYKQNDPIFDPSASSTYNTVSCNSNICSDLDQASCANGSTCQYRYSYGDGSSTVGLLSTETLTFDSEGKRTVSIPRIFFGCSHDTEGTFDPTDGGLVGLGGGPLSLVSQLGSSIDNKFSYCLVPYSDTTSSSLLNFGDQADVVGPDAVTTPLVPGLIETFYTLSLEEISVGNDKVGSGVGDIIIDSGTTLTILDNTMMAPLVDKVVQAVKYPRVKDSDLDLCFNVSGASGGSLEFPELTFEFRGAPVTLPPMNAFVELDAGVVCLAIVSTGEDGGIRIFGNIAQQNLHIGYDLGTKKLTFAPADCANL